jgi:hypothetical protein
MSLLACRPTAHSPLLVLFMPRIASAQQITVQQPVFGIAIDANGVLSRKEFPDPTGRLMAKRAADARATMPGDILRRSDLRKVSLVRLEQAIADRLEAGKSPDDAMRHLAGLQRAQYVFLYPEERDLVIAGPAEARSKIYRTARQRLTTSAPRCWRICWCCGLIRPRPRQPMSSAAIDPEIGV